MTSPKKDTTDTQSPADVVQYDQAAISRIQRAADTSKDPEKIAHMKRAQRAFARQQSTRNKTR